MRKKKILLIDNYDSFTFNLKHLIQSIPKTSVSVKRNDQINIKSINNYHAVIIGPGPGSPEDNSYFGINKEIILNKESLTNVPILGICLGFQGIIYHLGGKIKTLPCPMHGKVSQLHITKKHPIVENIPDNINIMRYHSIYADNQYPLPKTLDAIAFTRSNSSSKKENGKELMIIAHKTLPIIGLQFHPESFATEYGRAFIENFLKLL